jgi:hypothetical protein
MLTIIGTGAEALVALVIASVALATLRYQKGHR